MPADSIKLCYIYGINKQNAVNYMALAFFHFPLSCTDAHNPKTTKATMEGAISGFQKLRFLGLRPSEVNGAALGELLQADADAPIYDCTDDTIVYALDLAYTMVGMHLESLSLEANSAKEIQGYIKSVPTVMELGIKIYELMEVEEQTFPVDLSQGGGGTVVIKLNFDKSSAHSSGPLSILSYSAQATTDPISYTFESVLYGGNVSVSIGMYTSDNFLAAGCATGYMPNQGGSTSQDSSGVGSSCSDPGPSPDISHITNNMGDLAVALYMNEKKIPLTASTRYEFLRKTGLNADNNHTWVEGSDAPTEIADFLVAEPIKNQLALTG